MNALAVDLGGTHLRAALFDGGQLGPVTTIAHGASGEQPLAPERLGEWLRGVIENDTVAAGISIAGTVEGERGVVLVADNLGWEDVPLAATLAAALSLPVRIDTDTFCGAAAEARFGGAGDGVVLSVAIGTGIGHAWIVDGEVWRGARDAATMFGHLVVDPAGPPCYCGARGCLCQYAAGPVLRAAIGQPDEAAIRGRATDALALAIAHALTLLNPDEVVLGGGAVDDDWPDLSELSRRVEILVHPEVRPIGIRRSRLGNKANLLGAGLLGIAMAPMTVPVGSTSPSPGPTADRGEVRLAPPSTAPPLVRHSASTNPSPCALGEGLG